MLKPALIAVLAVSALSPAAASPPAAPDSACRLTQPDLVDPTGPDERQDAVVSGGPVLRDGTLTCTIHVDGALHADPDNGPAVSGTGTHGVTVAGPERVSYDAWWYRPAYLCSRFADAGGATWVYDAASRAWVEAATHPAAECAQILEIGPTGNLDPLLALLEELLPQ